MLGQETTNLVLVKNESSKATSTIPNDTDASPVEKCRLCGCRLSKDEDDNFELELCGSCKVRPEARRLGVGMAPVTAKKVPGAPRVTSARDFTIAEKALIKKVHGYMPGQQLLNILNERLVCDLGPDAIQYSMEQLYNEIGDVSIVSPSGGHDWASLRKLLAKAQRDGTLDVITEQTINDFAIVYSLNHKQVLVLKDIVLQAQEE